MLLNDMKWIFKEYIMNDRTRADKVNGLNLFGTPYILRECSSLEWIFNAYLLLLN